MKSKNKKILCYKIELVMNIIYTLISNGVISDIQSVFMLVLLL